MIIIFEVMTIVKRDQMMISMKSIVLVILGHEIRKKALKGKEIKDDSHLLVLVALFLHFL